MLPSIPVSATASSESHPQPPRTLPPLPAGIPASYVTSYASPLKSSRVGAMRRRYASLDRVPIGWPEDPSPVRLLPRFVFASPDGAHLIVDWTRSFDYRDGTGKHIGGARKVAPRFDLTAADDAFYIYGNDVLWSGASTGVAPAVTGYTDRGSMLAFRFDKSRRIIVNQDSPIDPHGGDDWGVDVFADRFAKPDRSYAEVVFWKGYRGHGVAAIGADWRIVLAMDDGRLRILSDTGNAQDTPIELLRVKLPYAATTLSLAPPLILTTSDGDAGTTVHALDDQGVEKWRADVAFSVRQPPVDGAGRVVVIGSGIAAIEDGRIVWSQVSAVPMLGTAFADGTLAVSVGSELRIVDREGTILQSLRTAEGDTVMTPPCIVSDGSVWVATERALYVAR